MKTIAVFAKEKPGLNKALEYLNLYKNNVLLYKGKPGDPFPEEALNSKPDISISFLSPWIIKEQVLDNTRQWAINFHPGPPEYPGTGCTNFAIYNEEKTFGITAHIMKKKVDTGEILMVKRFPILSNDSVYSLTQRCYDYIIITFYELLDYIMENDDVPHPNNKWKREAYKRVELNKLCEITNDMDPEEINKRIKATTYPGMPGAFIELNGKKFVYVEKNNIYC